MAVPHPRPPATSAHARLTLHGAIRQVLTEAIDREGTTFRDYRMVNGESGRNADFLIAYGQSGRPCPRCATPPPPQAPPRRPRHSLHCPTCQRH